MSEQEIFEKVQVIIGEKLKVDPARILPKSFFVDDLGADSIDMIELFLALEQAFKVEIPDEEAEKIITVQQTVNYIGGVLQVN